MKKNVPARTELANGALLQGIVVSVIPTLCNLFYLVFFFSNFVLLLFSLTVGDIKDLSLDVR